MKTLNLCLLAILSAILMSCGDSGNTVNPTSEKIQGPLGDYFEVAVKDYKVKDDKISIEFKRIKEGFPAPWAEGMEVGNDAGYFEPSFTVEFQDADGSVLGKDDTDIVWDEEDLSSLAALSVDESTTITFSCDYEDAKQFKVSSTFKVHLEDNSSSTYITSDDEEQSSSDESTSTFEESTTDESTSPSEDWDAVLDSYDSYVTKYVSLAKKAANGDITAISEYASLLESAQELSEKLNAAKSELSSSQLSRYMKITQKMTDAAI